MDNERMFCTQCGKELDVTDRFCPGCGSTIAEDGSAQPRYTEYNTDTCQKKHSDNRMLILILCLVWGVIALYEGISTVAAVDASIEMMKTDMADMWDIIIDSMGEGAFRSYLMATGIACIVSGVTALFSGVLMYTRKNYAICLICCVISAICGCSILVGVFGFVVAYLISQQKWQFKDEHY